MNKRVVAAVAISWLSIASAQAKEVIVKVDSRAAPWRTGINPKLAFGLANAKTPAVLFDPLLRDGVTLHITASGQTTTLIGGDLFDANGQSDWTQDRGTALFPSHYMDTRKAPIHLNELVGAFIDADGKVIDKPFPIGTRADVQVPDGAAALSMGINDDNYSDNTGMLTVTVRIPEPKVIVEDGDKK